MSTVDERGEVRSVSGVKERGLVQSWSVVEERGWCSERGGGARGGTVEGLWSVALRRRGRCEAAKKIRCNARLGMRREMGWLTVEAQCCSADLWNSHAGCNCGHNSTQSARNSIHRAHHGAHGAPAGGSQGKLYALACIQCKGCVAWHGARACTSNTPIIAVMGPGCASFYGVM